MCDGVVVVESIHIQPGQFIANGGIPRGVGPVEEVFLQIEHVLLDHGLRRFGTGALGGAQAAAEFLQALGGEEGRFVGADGPEEQAGNG